MKKIAFVASILLVTVSIFLAIASAAFAAPVTSAVFSITSSAATPTANLRVATMTPKTIGRDWNSQQLQTFLLAAGQTTGYFLTKSQTINIATSLCVLIQADQDTTMKINSESAGLTIYSGQDTVRCFK